jgi:hypothetical protein
MKIHTPKTVARALAACFVFAAGAAVLSATVVASPPDPPNYWPLKLGATWTLQTKVGTDTLTQVATVTDVKRDGASTLATLDYKSKGKSLNTEVYRVSASGISRISGGNNNSVMVNPPIPIIQYPLTAGKSWTWSGEIVTNGKEVKASSKFTVSGPEAIKTAAGSFKAMHVTSELVLDPSGQKIKMPNHYWFAAGVGLVRQTATIGPTEIAGELTSYKLK